MIRIDGRQISDDDTGPSGQMRLARDRFIRNGYAILDHVLPLQKVEMLCTKFQARYARYVDDRERDETLAVGNPRFLVPVEFSRGFADPAICGNAYVVALARELLDPDAVRDNFGAIVSLSGAETVVLPLIEMNEKNGTTMMWPGSHRWKIFEEGSARVAPLSPAIPAGSAFMWDCGLAHRGMANVSGEHRPMIYSVYARSWYLDAANFKKAAQRRPWFGDDLAPAFPRSDAVFLRVSADVA